MTPLTEEERQNLISLLASHILKLESFIGDEFAVRLATRLVERGWRRPPRASGGKG